MPCVVTAVMYDSTELQPNLYRFQNSTVTWLTKRGVCEDMAELEASMLKAIGIPTETIQGVVQSTTQTSDPTGTNGDNHEWIKAFDGQSWVVADPTWSGDDSGGNGWMTNRFFTNTHAFRTTHTADSSFIGTSE